MTLPNETELMPHKAAAKVMVVDYGLFCTFRNIMDGTYTYKLMEISVDDYCMWVSGGVCIQDAMPHLSADDRELFLTGMSF